MSLNYTHLRAFHAVATEGHLTRAAERLNVAQSALSAQIKALEARLGVDLFDRVGRRLELTEAGRIALDHAARIFGTGDEMLARLMQAGRDDPPLRVGALSTLSRNFQMQFLAPLLDTPAVPITLRSGDTDTLLSALEDLALDVVLTTEVPRSGFAARRIAEQRVGLHGIPSLAGAGSLDQLLALPLILPTDTVIRSGFADLVGARELHIAAEVDDMAMLRLLTRAGAGLALAPAVVLADEIAAGTIRTAPIDLGLMEPFYAVTRPRSYAHPALERVLNAPQSPTAH
ncbi:MAG: LysR family transcriptional regulator [Pseudomonadota bacterium]